MPRNGLNAAFNETAHVIVAEPRETLIRISIVDYDNKELAYETASLGTLRNGYRPVGKPLLPLVLARQASPTPSPSPASLSYP